MYTSPSCADLLDAVLVTLRRDIVPDVQTARSRVQIEMIEAILLSVKQRIHEELPQMASESDHMRALFAEAAAVLAGSENPAAARIAHRAVQLAGLPQVPEMPHPDSVSSAYRTLSEALPPTLEDLYVVMEAGEAAASELLDRFRSYLASRTQQTMRVVMASSGLVGRA